MAPYTSAQRSLITQFCSFTQAKESIAAKHLKNQDWNVERAIDVYYGNISGDSPLSVALGQIFDKYRNSQHHDKILIDEAQKYLGDLNIALDEPVHLALCDLLSSPQIGEFHRESFISGWTDASKESNNPLNTVAKQATHLATLRKQLKSDPTYLKKIYRASFIFAKPEGQRSVPGDAAVEFWRMFFSSSAGGIDWKTPTSPNTPWLDLWIDFYESQHKRPVNKDLWNMIGELMLKTIDRDGETLSWYSEDGAWPMAIDDFIAWVKEKQPEVGTTTDTNNDEMDTS